jgi:hypothetical protein
MEKAILRIRGCNRTASAPLDQRSSRSRQVAKLPVLGGRSQSFGPTANSVPILNVQALSAWRRYSTLHCPILSHGQIRLIPFDSWIKVGIFGAYNLAAGGCSGLKQA